jgi:HEAT repeat protein
MHAFPGWGAAPFQCARASTLLLVLAVAATLVAGCKADPTNNPFLTDAADTAEASEAQTEDQAAYDESMPGYDAVSEARGLVDRLKQRGEDLQDSAAVATDAARGLRDEVQQAVAETGDEVRQAAAETADAAREQGQALAEQTIEDVRQTARATSRAAQLQAVQSLEDWSIERAGPLLLVAMSEGSPEVQRAAAEQLARRWAPAARYTVDSVARGRAQALARLQEQWVQQYGQVDQAMTMATAQANHLVGETEQHIGRAQAAVEEGANRLHEVQQAVAAFRQADLPEEARRQAAESLARLSTDTDKAVRVRAAQSMGEAGDPAFMPALMGLLDDEPEVQVAAMQSLERIAGSDVTAPADGRSLSTDERARSWQLWYREQQNTR